MLSFEIVTRISIGGVFVYGNMCLVVYIMILETGVTILVWGCVMSLHYLWWLCFLY